MTNNVSKQILLSVIGVAILVIAVVGVSFALYINLNYNNSDNSPYLGVEFKPNDKRSIEIKNSLPVSMAEGRQSEYAVSFTVTGTVDEYEVRVISYDDKNKLRDSEVFAYITSDEVDGISFKPNGNFGTTGQALGSNNVILGSGKISSKNKDIVRSFNIHFWVDNSAVTLGADGTYTEEEYSNKVYSLRVQVEIPKNK